LRFDKNTVLDAEFRRSDGRTFQATGPATVNNNNKQDDDDDDSLASSDKSEWI